MNFFFFKGCDRNFTESIGNISSLNWPQNYSHYANCEYRIQVSEGYSIVLDITHFDVEFESLCEYDYMQVSDY